ncbi:MAG: hypothetical protein ACM32E_19485 [Gemmatimonadota bacterium]
MPDHLQDAAPAGDPAAANAFPPPAGPPAAFPPPVGLPLAGPPPPVQALPAPTPPARRPGWPGRLLLILLLVAGLAGVGGGGTGLFIELTRQPTRAEVTAAGQAEVASRWQRLPAGQLFPATISYITSDATATSAARVGIAPEASCAAALDAGIRGLFQRYGCSGVLRATYLDASGTVAGTVGVAIMRSPAAAAAVAERVPPGAGLRAVPFPGTRAALFGSQDRGLPLDVRAEGPYVLLWAGGATDGRPAADLPAGVSVDMGSGIVARETDILTGRPRPCARKDVRC